MTDPICLLCGWPKSTHEEKNRFCLLRPRFLAMNGERERIVAWLRKQAEEIEGVTDVDRGKFIARRTDAIAIARGDHLRDHSKEGKSDG